MIEAKDGDESAAKSGSLYLMAALPRSLVYSSVWQNLTAGEQLFYFYLLSFSNVSDFRPCWPSQPALQALSGFKPQTQRLFTAALKHAGILEVHPPGSYPYPEYSKRTGFIPSLVYEFTLAEWQNKDAQAANKIAISKGRLPRFKEVKDLVAMGSAYIVLCRLQKVTPMKNRVAGLNSTLDVAARLIRISGHDSDHVYLDIYSSSRAFFNFVKKCLPPKVILKARKVSKDLEINNFKNWKSLEDKIADIQDRTAERLEADIFSRTIAQLARLTPEIAKKVS